MNPSNTPFGLSADSPLLGILEEFNGARFYKCALQVNPWAYLMDNGKAQGFADEATYNTALVEALVQAEIEIIGITDHWRANTASSLMEAAQARGILVLPGFEAATVEGIHVICLFEQGSDLTYLDSMAQQLYGRPGAITDARNGTKSLAALLELVKGWGGICIAAHMITDNGILRHNDGEVRMESWKLESLLAGCIPGSLASLGVNHHNFYNIICNKDVNYRRKHPVALVNAGDVSDPANAGDDDKSCFIKMAEVTVEGLRQAFLDPASRIRITGDAEHTAHVELIAASWQGGLLDGVTLRFNENLNVLIGGRGTGKSTLLETLRYALAAPPLGKEALAAHEGSVKNALQNGGKVSLLVRQPRPTAHTYLLERSYPGPPQVRNEAGNVMNIKPVEVINPLPEMYGQHEIAELARDPDKLTYLLHRFLPVRPDAERQKADLRRAMSTSRIRLLEIAAEIDEADSKLSRLPILRETLSKYEAAGLEAKLQVQTQWQSEARLFGVAKEKLAPLDRVVASMRETIPLDKEPFSQTKLQDLPNAQLLGELRESLSTMEATLSHATEQVTKALEAARQKVENALGQWKPLRTIADAEFTEQLRQLQKDENIDGTAFLRLKRDIEDLLPLEKRVAELDAERRGLLQQRRNLLASWETLLQREYQALKKASDQVNGQLAPRVRVNVAFQGQREELRSLLDKALSPGTHRKPIIDVIIGTTQLSLRGLATACRGNTNDLQQAFPLTLTQAERLSRISSESCFQLEELELAATTQVELNVAPIGEEAHWRDLAALSVGQRATAVLRLLLLKAPTPLIIDQPEDDLDNRFIAEDIVPRINKEKMQRQFLFATHNANLPVLGDAELIVGLAYQQGQVHIAASGSLDTPQVHQLVEEVLEGGREAFEMRRAKYGF
jgi:ABC-type lipoprotein export system ATPase subunit